MLQPLVYRYDEEEWRNVILPDPDWSREETDYLLDLCELFRLRFVHVADRYQVCQLWSNNMTLHSSIGSCRLLQGSMPAERTHKYHSSCLLSCCACRSSKHAADCGAA